jgi:hypothetical protein
MIAADVSLHHDSTHENHVKIFASGPIVFVFGYGTTESESAMIPEIQENSICDIPTDIIKVASDTVGCHLFEFLVHFPLLVIDGNIESEFLG